MKTSSSEKQDLFQIVQESHPITLSKLQCYFQGNPFWENKVPTMEYLWEFQIDGRVEEIWPYVSDTSMMNRLMSMSKIHLEEREGLLYAQTLEGAISMAWKELPWIWQKNLFLQVERLYSKGPAKYLRFLAILQPWGNNQTKVYYYLGWIPKNGFYGLALKIAMNIFQKRYNKALKFVEKEIHRLKARRESRQSLPLLPFSNPPLKGEIKEKVLSFIEKMKSFGIDPGFGMEIFTLLINAPMEYVDRIRPLFWKPYLSCSEDDLLLFFLSGVKVGAFLLTWDIICPHCKGVRRELQNLGDLPEKERCEPCQLEFSMDHHDLIEVIFHFHPQLRKTEKILYCAAEPAKKKHIYLAQKLEGNESRHFSLVLKPGNYNLRVRGRTSSIKLEVVDNLDLKNNASSQPKSIKSSSESFLSWKMDSSDTLLLSSKQSLNLKVTNPYSSQEYLVLERIEYNPQILFPRKLFNFSKFRDLFREETLGSKISLQIGNQAILFTDLVGSTRFYDENGDAKAFKAVREHFIEAFRIIESMQGVIVKTIGDAIMASFDSPLQALKAAITLQENFHPKKENTLNLRISLHYGPCLAVNLNTGIDYFGKTVNLAAKLQGLVEAGQIVLTYSMYKEKEINTYLDSKEMELEELDFSFPWNPETYKVLRFSPTLPLDKTHQD
ncbi:MAG: adenylate/guanylate cyclase domain-containing protein [Planctomycetota bacterium]|nr:MAG: adenylate/guanylate cyclase domain-containing protein [Planctomycetota bacterium]